ncbi:544_t:CDS:2 [Diversispora eburnea]|uniref:544_t:CDS:1 n=1 Tax=Diversispora eburnea TaxID=1213867 RepID=A0A9N9CD43_9GLOM|nr:544_t:CDS:2 [Diversispora eburnea]
MPLSFGGVTTKLIASNSPSNNSSSFSRINASNGSVVQQEICGTEELSWKSSPIKYAGCDSNTLSSSFFLSISNLSSFSTLACEAAEVPKYRYDSKERKFEKFESNDSIRIFDSLMSTDIESPEYDSNNEKATF